MKNCYDCKFCKTLRVGMLSYSELNAYQPSEHILLEQSDNMAGDLVGKCDAGHNERMRDFKKEHGTKTRTEIEADISLDMPCYEMTDGAKILQSMIDSTDRMIELLKVHKENTDPIAQ